MWSAAEERSGTAAFYRRSPARGSSTLPQWKAAATLRYAAALQTLRVDAIYNDRMRTFVVALAILFAMAAHAADRTVTLQLENVPIREAIQDIAEQAKVNIAIDPQIRGRVTANLRDVTPQFALRAVLDQIGATYSEERGVIRIVRAKRGRV